MSLHQQLWTDNRILAQACLDHPFVQGLGRGDLKPAAFRRYVAQDAFFLKAFLRAYAMAAAKCDDPEHTRTLVRMQQGALEELTLHAVLAERLDIPLGDVTPYFPTRAYTDFLLRTAWEQPLDVILAALAPCMRLYAFLGTELAAQMHADHPYGEWIRTYAGEPFQKLAAELESLLDAVAADRPAVRDAYRHAMQCELRFFSGPLEDMP